MVKIAIVVGSTRPGRKADAVARWVQEISKKRKDAEFEIVDIQDFNLPLLDEPMPPMMARYTRPHTKAWAAKIATFDGYVFVTPEYNHGPSGALKNAIDYLYAEWNNKAAGFVSYGGGSGIRAVEQLRLVMAELQVASVRAEVNLSLLADFENFTTFKPDPTREKRVDAMLEQVIAWSGALKTLPTRNGTADSVVHDRTDPSGESAGPVVLVNVFTPKAGKLDQFIAAQTGEYRRLLGKIAGWQGNRLHRSLDGKTAVNYAVFDSLSAYTAWRGSALFAEHLKVIEPLVERAEPGLYSAPLYQAGSV